MKFLRGFIAGVAVALVIIAVVSGLLTIFECLVQELGAKAAFLILVMVAMGIGGGLKAISE